MTNPAPMFEHVIADISFAPTRSTAPSSLICLCGESLEAPAQDIGFEFAQHRQAVRAARNTHRSSLGPRVVAEGFDFGRRLK